jgi:5-methyltetrahydrofolate--homocysteine methyltransferase
MEELLNQLSGCIERGKIDKNFPFPPDLQGQDGATELTKQLLDAGVSANEVLKKALMVGMHNIGDKFGQGLVFIPDLLLAARAMNAAMTHLKPYFETGQAQHRGTVVLGTVAGDLHDIGKNIVGMVLEGNGWKVVDLGADVAAEKFISAVKENPGSMIGMSALLTTTMINMEASARKIKSAVPGTKIFVGGAPLTKNFSDKIGADGYFPEPYGLIKYLEALQ